MTGTAVNSRHSDVALCVALMVLCAVARMHADETTWTAKPRHVQLAEDPQPLPKGKGMLFVPALSVPRGNEPSYQVFHEGRKIAD